MQLLNVKGCSQQFENSENEMNMSNAPYFGLRRITLKTDMHCNEIT